MLRDDVQAVFTGQLVGNLPPGCSPRGRSVHPTASSQGVELGAHEHRRRRPRHGLHSSADQDAVDAQELPGLGASVRQVVQQRERVRLAAAELRHQVVDCVGTGCLTRQAAHHLRRQVRQVAGQEGALEEAHGVLVVSWSVAVAHLVQMHRELGGIQRPALAQILARRYHLVPGLQHHTPKPFFRARSPSTQRFSSVFAG